MFTQTSIMINKIQHSFSIQDLEILSGIKAHTIRIWEKRYSLLNPTRLNRNIRVYSLIDLQKILNTSLLQKHQFKISEIAKLTDSEIEKKAKAIALNNFQSNYHLNSLLVSMFSFDDELFEEIYEEQTKSLNFREIYVNTYLPLLHHIGLLWQTKSIKPAQEHFISNLIYQKIVLTIAKTPNIKAQKKRVNVLFLPEGEVHEIGLLYMMYHLKVMGEKIIYLGRDIPTEDLFDINSQFQEINWICSFVIDRTDEEKTEFIAQMEQLLRHTKNTCMIIGSIWRDYLATSTVKNITFHEGFDKLV